MPHSCKLLVAVEEEASSMQKRPKRAQKGSRLVQERQSRGHVSPADMSKAVTKGPHTSGKQAASVWSVQCRESTESSLLSVFVLLPVFPFSCWANGDGNEEGGVCAAAGKLPSATAITSVWFAQEDQRIVMWRWLSHTICCPVPNNGERA